ncbi:MAG: hypothetical protein QNJ18_12860 [Xenococcaceae cyanobacterium MO_167.B52]|nr:hypothetical protein [Xenococcaceae cyanobacterium MO_167.B52]
MQPYSTSGSVLTFNFLQQYYAGAQTQVPNLVVGQASGYTTASQPIDLTSSDPNTQTNNTTNMSVDPSLGLSVPAYTEGVQSGAYRIVTPQFNSVAEKYNAGLAIQNASTGTVVLSNFINAEPLKNIDCQPILIFYVQTGNYEAGSVINFTTSSVGAALCDTTQGITTFNVDYNADGSWTVNSIQNYAGLTQLLNQSALTTLDSVNVTIENEAGTQVLSTGTVDIDTPFTVTNLTNPNSIVVNSDYQIAAGAGYTGYTCTGKVGNDATFV